jgi:uncharacterized protein YxjI
MGPLRHRDDGPAPTRYRMQEKLISVGDDYWVEDEDGARAYKVDGKALRVRDTWILKDTSDRDVATIRERKLSVRDAMTIEIGDRKAVVKKAVVGIRDRFHIEVEGGDDLKAHGNVVDHEYEIEGSDGTIATVSKRWFRVRDTYGVEVAPGADPVLALAVTVAIDALAHDRG